ncbi:MAG: glycosyltransferase, partial [Sciscionella sp.]
MAAETSVKVSSPERESAQPDRHADNVLTAARGLFRGPVDTVPADLYAEVLAGTATRERHEATVHPHSLLSLNTYFGRFPASYWQRWSVVTEVHAELVLSGTGRVTVLATDINGESRPVAAAAPIEADVQRVRLRAPIAQFLDGGALYVQVETEDATLRVHSLRWQVSAPRRLRPTAVVICTYNRVEDCLNTLSALSGDAESLALIDTVYVVDQGSDRVDSRERYADVAAALGGKLRYLRQPNLGGAGGFSRGMYEVTATPEGEHTDVLLMDDDVLLDPELVVRMTAFANRTSTPTLVGGQMLRLLHPNYLFAGAEWADMDEFAPGRPIPGALDDADLLARDAQGRRDLGERRVDADYNAWWSCLIPAEVINSIGYPLPLFFQWDDIEFGYRAKSSGFPTVTLPGAGLWHADFDWKDIDEWNRYFSIRNAMICASLHGRLDARHTARVILAQVIRNLIAMQYGLTATIIRAAQDYLAGPEMLRDGGTAVAAEIRALRADYPDTKRHPVAELAGLGLS